MPTENLLYGNESSSVSKRLVNLAKPLSIRCILVLVCLMMNFVGTAYANNQLKAFACAQGFGATATGGRGGDVYHVTKLSDDGSQGTLRHAINSANGPRTVVFDIGGIIKLNSRLKLKTDNITLAGQTAPGGGITLAGYPFDIVNRSDVIIRYIRFRVGDYNARDPDGGNNGKGNKNLGGAGGDAIFAENVNRLILDHISASWSMDETVDITQSKNITIQHSIISEGLYNSFHQKGPHSRGVLFFAGVTDSELANGNGGYTIYQNLLAHNNMRNPVVGGQPYLDAGQAEKDRRFMAMDFVNNVVYDWGVRSGHSGRPQTKMNYVNNYLIAGPSTVSKNLHTAMHEENKDEGDFYIYIAGNYMDIDKDNVHDGLLVGGEAFLGYDSGEVLSHAFPFPVITPVLSANGGYQEVLGHAGSSLARDDVDWRVINNVINRTGGIIDSPDDVGGLGSIARGIKLTDTDRDGMPDNWELANGLNPNKASDRNSVDLSTPGYTNLEVYLDSIVAAAGHCGVESNETEITVTAPDTQTPSIREVEEVDPVVVTTAETSSIDIQISTSSDDVEEKKSGTVITGSGDLDLVRSGDDQTIGMRFNAVNIPKGATITNASIQFTAASVGSKQTNLVIKGKAEDNAATFKKVAFNVSSAPTTSANVLWSPQAWSKINESGSKQRTPSIASVIQEIIDRSGWNQKNALTVIISGTGKREAISYDGNSNAAPILHVEYVTNTVVSTTNNAPKLSIQGPVDGLKATVSDAINFIGSSDDDNDGDLSASLSWSSNLDGLLGKGGSVSASLSQGTHLITASSTDSDGLATSKTIQVTIEPEVVKADPVKANLEIQISSSNDDVEEKASGKVIIGSGDLDLVRSGGNQTIGMRFTSVSIPKGAIITNASIQFTAESVGSKKTNLVIKGKAEDDASVFKKVAFDVSSARTTSSRVSWSPQAWSKTNESGFKQRTPNLASIIQEIIDRPGWDQDNALAMIISGTGKREAVSYDGNPDAAPRLFVEYIIK
ncbi:MAG: hypothetical protein V3V18_14525 [Methylococcales bacterium]